MRRTARARSEAPFKIKDKDYTPSVIKDDDALKVYWKEVEEAMLNFLQRTGLGFADLPFNRNAKINVKTMSYDTSDPKANVKVVRLCQC